jgi:phosphodiesterase/alkaline phosphatase D-like protein
MTTIRGAHTSLPSSRAERRRGRDGQRSGPVLVLGPLLRHVGTSDATVWVETSERCTVEVCAGALASAQRTFTVAGHHYAVVTLEGLEPGSRTPYEVRLDGRPVWPLADSPYPPSVIPAVEPGATFRLAFGSCRSPSTVEVQDPGGSGEDVLAAYARTLAARRAEWPDALLLLGDQVYADETSPKTVSFIRARRDIGRPPYRQVADFEEYTQLYREAWSDPDVRWLLSTVPTSMIFDDHDVIDDWNTSRS